MPHASAVGTLPTQVLTRWSPGLLLGLIRVSTRCTCSTSPSSASCCLQQRRGTTCCSTFYASKHGFRRDPGVPRLGRPCCINTTTSQNRNCLHNYHVRHWIALHPLHRATTCRTARSPLQRYGTSTAHASCNHMHEMTVRGMHHMTH